MLNDPPTTRQLRATAATLLRLRAWIDRNPATRVALAGIHGQLHTLDVAAKACTTLADARLDYQRALQSVPNDGR